MVPWMRAHFGALVKLYRVGVVCFIALLFIDHGPMFTLLLMLIPPTSVSVVVAPSFHCLDVVTLIVRSYDFWFMTVFSFLQWSVLGCVFSDARILMCVTGFIGTQQAMLVDANVRNFRVWSHWALILDGLTPNIMRDVLGFSKRYAIPVSASVVLSGLVLLGLILYVSPGTLHNRVLWEHTVASKRIISIQTQTILLGRIFTIVFWCSRQTVLLFLRKEDELQSLYTSSSRSQGPRTSGRRRDCGAIDASISLIQAVRPKTRVLFPLDCSPETISMASRGVLTSLFSGGVPVR